VREVGYFNVSHDGRPDERVGGVNILEPLDHTDPTDAAAAWVRKAYSVESLEDLKHVDFRAYHRAEFMRLWRARFERGWLAAAVAWVKGNP
jgi:hypothetical protein